KSAEGARSPPLQIPNNSESHSLAHKASTRGVGPDFRQRRRQTPMSDPPLMAHELLCLHLKCFYDVQPCSPYPPAPTVRAIAKKAGRKSRLFRRGITRI